MLWTKLATPLTQESIPRDNLQCLNIGRRAHHGQMSKFRKHANDLVSAIMDLSVDADPEGNTVFEGAKINGSKLEGIKQLDSKIIELTKDDPLENTIV